jgi:hypothetical protein
VEIYKEWRMVKPMANIKEFTSDSAVQEFFWESWGDIAGQYGMTPPQLWPTRAERGGPPTLLVSLFGKGSTVYHVKTVKGLPVASQGITDYGEFYGGAGSRSLIALINLIGTKTGNKPKELKGVPVIKQWSKFGPNIIEKYIDKPLIFNAKNKKLHSIWKNLRFTNFTGGESYLSNELLSALSKNKEYIMTRPAGSGDSIKNAFASIWARHISTNIEPDDY